MLCQSIRRCRSAFSLLIPLVIVVGSVWLPCDAGAAAEQPKVTRYELRVHVLPAEQRLTVAAQITISNTTGTPQREIPFLLYRLLTVDAAEDANGAPLAFRQAVVSMADRKNWQVNAAVVTLREPLAPGGTIRITLKYSGAIFGYQEVMGYVRDHVGEDYTLLRPDTMAYPMLAEASAPSRSAAYDTLFTYALEIQAPHGYLLACGGLSGEVSVEGDTETHRCASRAPTWRMDIAVAKFQLQKNEAGNLAVYALPGDESGAANLLKEMQRVMAFYTRRFGPSEKATAYTVIEIPDGWGSQASDFYILQTAAAFKDPKRANELYHEIGHSWNVKAKREVQRTRWFDEAFASYFEALAMGAFAGPQAFDERMNASREHFRSLAKKDPRNASTPIAEYGKEERGGNSYTKGAWSLYVLEQTVGTETFNEILRAWLAEFANRPADFQDFQRVAERVAKRDLTHYFNEWIFGAESSELLTGNLTVEQMAARYREAAPKK